MDDDLIFGNILGKQNDDRLNYLDEIFPDETNNAMKLSKSKAMMISTRKSALPRNTTQKESIAKSQHILDSNYLVESEKKEQLVKVMKEYEYRVNKSNNMQLSSLGHEKKLKKVVNLKNTLFKKYSNRRKEINLVLCFKDSVKNKEIMQNEDNIHVESKKKHHVNNMLNKYKSIYKKISHKQKHKIESRYKKIRELYIQRKKVKKQIKKKTLKPKNFLHYQNYGHIDFNKLIKHIEQNDWRAFIEKKSCSILNSK